MDEHPLAIIPEHHLDIIVWIAPFIATDAVADLKEGNLLGAAVNSDAQCLGLENPRTSPDTVRFPRFR